MAFSRDREAGERICRALEGDYSPRLRLYSGPRSLARALEEEDLLLPVMAVGIVVRLLVPHLRDKWTDRPVVAVDSALTCAVPVVGGHHGANDLARHLARRMGLFPAVTTATDARGRPHLEAVASSLGREIVNRDSSLPVNLAFLRQDVPVVRISGPKVVLVDDDVAVLKSSGGVVVGIGTRKGVSREEVLSALDRALQEAGRTRDDVRAMASAWLKRDEEGIAGAAACLGKEVVFLPPEVLNAQMPVSSSRASDLGLVGVAEPAALALSCRLIMPKKVYGRVTIALGE
ncbi:MAG: cobalt-precorrin 5A hydrolase [Methanosarcinales archaeon]|nr:cobalt-precorrin 5A hydrolase [Methanosarcinales archaeon]